MRKQVAVLGQRVSCVALSAQGDRLAAACDDGIARVWQLEGSDLPLLLSQHEAAVTWVGFSPDGEQIATTSMDGTARLWSASGAHSATLDVGTSAVWSGCYLVHADARLRLLTASSNGLVHTWLAHEVDAVALVKERVGFR